MVFTTVYISTMRAVLADVEFQHLLEVSRARNAQRGITGMLTIRGCNVMQLLEGDEHEVRVLFDRIRRDSRHDDILTVWSSTHPIRRYPDWLMGVTSLEPSDADPFVNRRGLCASDWREWSSDLSEYTSRRDRALARALASGNPLTSSLAIILNAHQPEPGADRTEMVPQCAECRPPGSVSAVAYPCFTARNALWAIESL